MGSAVWLASATGLIGVALGGMVSLAVNHQQIRETRKQSEKKASEKRYQRSVDRRFKAYSEFIIDHRPVQHALRFYYSQRDGRPSTTDLNALFQSAYDSAAMVFLVVETKRTYDATRGVLRALEEAQRIVHGNGSITTNSPGRSIDIALGKAMREFQNSARSELEVDGPEWPWIKDREPPEDPGAKI